MPTFNADTLDVSGVENFLTTRTELKHLRVRKHGPLVILESGPQGDPHPHARLRRVTKQWWSLEMPTHTGRWEKTPFRGPRNEVLQLLLDQFGWTLAPLPGL